MLEWVFIKFMLKTFKFKQTYNLWKTIFIKELGKISCSACLSKTWLFVYHT